VVAGLDLLLNPAQEQKVETQYFLQLLQLVAVVENQEAPALAALRGGLAVAVLSTTQSLAAGILPVHHRRKVIMAVLVLVMAVVAVVVPVRQEGTQQQPHRVAMVAMELRLASQDLMSPMQVAAVAAVGPD